MPNGQPQQPQKIVVKTPDEKLEGKYTNYITVGFDEEAFGMDFFYIKLPLAGILMGRFALTPPHMKRLANLLQQKLQEYEKKYETKVEAAEEPSEIPMGIYPEKE